MVWYDIVWFGMVWGLEGGGWGGMVLFCFFYLECSGIL